MMDAVTDQHGPHGLDGLLHLSRSMLALAESGDWEELALLEAERRAAVQTHFASLAPRQQTAGQVRAAIQEIINLNRQIEALCAAARAATMAQLKDLRRGARGVDAYREHHP